MSSEQPSGWQRLWRGLTAACPNCGQRGLFRRWRHMAARCPRCNLRFERIEGHWLGAIATNTVMSSIAIIATLLIALALTLPDTSGWVLLPWVLPVAVIAPFLLMPISKTFWTAVDLGMRPLEAHETAPESAPEAATD